MLPDLTGGRVVLNTNAPEADIPGIFAESDAYYVVAFEADTREHGQRPRSIEVKVNRSGVKVTAQRRYVAQPAAPAERVPGPPASDTRASLDSALSALLPNARMPLAMSAHAFAGSAPGEAIVGINVDAGAFVTLRDVPVPLEIEAVAIGQAGRVVASARQTSTVTISRVASTDRAEANVQTQLQVPPGDYEIRVAVSDPTRGAAGSVFSQVTVPVFGEVPLSLSDVTLETEMVGGDAAGMRSRARSVTTRRVFGRDDRVTAMLEVYQGTARTDAVLPVALRARVLDASGAAVRDHTLRLAAQQFVNRRAACRITVDVEHLPPGEYLLSLEAASGETNAGRTVRLVVR